MAELKGRILSGKILVKPVKAEEMSRGGIIIPDTVKEKPTEGKVIMVGEAKKDEPMEVKVGDEILFSKYAGQELNIEGEEYLLISQNDVLYIA